MDAASNSLPFQVNQEDAGIDHDHNILQSAAAELDLKTRKMTRAKCEFQIAHQVFLNKKHVFEQAAREVYKAQKKLFELENEKALEFSPLVNSKMLEIILPKLCTKDVASLRLSCKAVSQKIAETSYYTDKGCWKINNTGNFLNYLMLSHHHDDNKSAGLIPSFRKFKFVNTIDFDQATAILERIGKSAKHVLIVGINVSGRFDTFLRYLSLSNKIVELMINVPIETGIYSRDVWFTCKDAPINVCAIGIPFFPSKPSLIRNLFDSMPKLTFVCCDWLSAVKIKACMGDCGLDFSFPEEKGLRWRKVIHIVNEKL